ncbi:hypothetical protein RBSWK_02486 [Rhodopirellula baltica SWK14]|jgi:hypothetical protein|uniref:Uncharacterized protein n=1 Tax=Rhodopirellula baltica SWK14 TaxID=993516 RepID=L7CH60_RHOBT|nr:hypothetical protein RBSWK_02486 [Rhodopirellula baltica SWK14]
MSGVREAKQRVLFHQVNLVRNFAMECNNSRQWTAAVNTLKFLTN